MKKLYKIFIVLILFNSSLFSQDTEAYEQSDFALNYNYYAFPYFIDLGYAYRKNSSQIFFPLVGLSYEFGKYAFNVFANAKMEYRYKRFYFSLAFKQGIIPLVGEGYNYDNLESYGKFDIGYYFDGVSIYYNLNVGNQYALGSQTSELSNIFQVNNYLGILATLYADASSELSLFSSVNLDTIPYDNEYSYGFSAKMPYTFFHYWGELGIMPAIYYSEYLENSTQNYSIGNNYLNGLIMLPIGVDINTLYNFMTYVHGEYKFYLRFLPGAFSSIYLVAYGNIGYGKKSGNSFDNGEMLYTTGGGIGYSLFGTPMQVTVGVDQRGDIVIGMFISPILHMF